MCILCVCVCIRVRVCDLITTVMYSLHITCSVTTYTVRSEYRFRGMCSYCAYVCVCACVRMCVCVDDMYTRDNTVYNSFNNIVIDFSTYLRRLYF